MPTRLPEPYLGFAAQSVAGRVRRHNEDAVLCCSELGLWAVADGMGGHQRGEVASALAVQILRAVVASGRDLSAATQAAHAAIVAAGQGAADRPGERARSMGSTLVAVRFSGADFELAWIGDSRAYRIDAQRIDQLTHDHSWVQSMVDIGVMSVDEARRHPRRNVVTQCLGQGEEALTVGLVTGTLAPGELLLLCSDGLSGELLDEQIQQQCAVAETLDEVVEQLIATANQLGGKDNISCIVLALGHTQSPPIVARPPNFISRWLKSLKP